MNKTPKYIMPHVRSVMLDRAIDNVLRNPESDDALHELVDCLPQESRDTLKTIMQTVLSDEESS